MVFLPSAFFRNSSEDTSQQRDTSRSQARRHGFVESAEKPGGIVSDDDRCVVLFATTQMAVPIRLCRERIEGQKRGFRTATQTGQSNGLCRDRGKSIANEMTSIPPGLSAEPVCSWDV